MKEKRYGVCFITDAVTTEGVFKKGDKIYLPLFDALEIVLTRLGHFYLPQEEWQEMINRIMYRYE